MHWNHIRPFNWLSSFKLYSSFLWFSHHFFKCLNYTSFISLRIDFWKNSAKLGVAYFGFPYILNRTTFLSFLHLLLLKIRNKDAIYHCYYIALLYASPLCTIYASLFSIRIYFLVFDHAFSGRFPRKNNDIAKDICVFWPPRW